MAARLDAVLRQAPLWDRPSASIEVMAAEAVDDYQAALRTPAEVDWERAIETLAAGLEPACQQVFADTIEKLAPLLGAASLAQVEGIVVGALQWARFHYDPDKGEFPAFAYAVAWGAWERFRNHIGSRQLFVEKDDEERRRRAASSEEELASYLDYVRQDMTRALAKRRHRPLYVIDEDAKSQDEIFAVITAVLAMMRRPSGLDAWSAYERTGVPAFYKLRDDVLRRHRRKLWVVVPPTDAMPHARILRPDEALLHREATQRHVEPVADRLRPRLSRRLVPYLDALLIELELDGTRWGLQDRIAARVGRHKSRVSEAMTKIRDVARAIGVAELLVLDDVCTIPVIASATRCPPCE
jgi:hypothetical protein